MGRVWYGPNCPETDHGQDKTDHVKDETDHVLGRYGPSWDIPEFWWTCLSLLVI